MAFQVLTMVRTGEVVQRVKSYLLGFPIFGLNRFRHPKPQHWRKSAISKRHVYLSYVRQKRRPIHLGKTRDWFPTCTNLYIYMTIYTLGFQDHSIKG